MSQIEKIFIFALCLAPVLALIFIIPWKKMFLGGFSDNKKEKPIKEKKVKETTAKVRPIKAKKSKTADATTTIPVFQHSGHSNAGETFDDIEEVKEESEALDKGFSEYLQSRRRRTTPTRRFDRMNDFDSSRDFTKPFNPFTVEEHRSFDFPTEKEEKTISEELQTISPELKALIISGALDRKNFDDMGENK